MSSEPRKKRSLARTWKGEVLDEERVRLVDEIIGWDVTVTVRDDAEGKAQIVSLTATFVEKDNTPIDHDRLHLPLKTIAEVAAAHLDQR